MMVYNCFNLLTTYYPDITVYYFYASVAIQQNIECTKKIMISISHIYTT